MDRNAGRVCWNRELHRSQVLMAFDEPSRDADVRRARPEAEDDEERAITDAYLGSDIDDD